MRLVALLSLLAAPVSAHELWISPESYRVAPGETIRAAIRVGEEFSGASYPWLPRGIERSEVVQGGAARPVAGRVGDRPAIAAPALGDGLAVIVHETTDQTVRYEDDFATWGRFTDHKGFPEAAERHLERGGAEDLVIEDYRRYAKSLVAVGSGEGADAAVGLDAEIVALANPYADGAGEVPVRVLYRGEAAPGKLVEVFERAPGGGVEIAEVTTDAEGVARVPVRPGHEYQVDSVFLEELDPPSGTGATFGTLWANLTFLVPEAETGTSPEAAGD